MNINDISIQAELERILASRRFRSRRSLRQFLSYIVKESLSTNPARITQYAIAVNALGRSESFDILDNPLVRVQAGRLRKQLEDYYATEGRFNPLRCHLPLGSYLPEFTHQHAEQPKHLVATEASIPWLSQGPNLICIPRTFAADETAGWRLIASLTRDYANALTHFNFFQVIFADETQWQQTNWPQEAWLKYNADVALFMDLYTEHKGYSLKCSLVHRADNQIIWAHSFALGNQPPSPVALQRIFKRIAHDTVSFESGCIHTHWARQLLASGKSIAGHHQVMVALRQYIWTLSSKDFHTVLQICEERLGKFPQDIQVMVVCAELCRADYLLKYNEIKPLHARSAQIAICPDAASTRQSLCATLLRPTLLVSRLKARNINPLDTHLDVVMGLMHMGMDDWRTGADYIQASVSISPNYPDWYHIPLSVYHYRTGHYLAALREAKKYT